AEPLAAALPVALAMLLRAQLQAPSHRPQRRRGDQVETKLLLGARRSALERLLGDRQLLVLFFISLHAVFSPFPFVFLSSPTRPGRRGGSATTCRSGSRAARPCRHSGIPCRCSRPGTRLPTSHPRSLPLPPSPAPGQLAGWGCSRDSPGGQFVAQRAHQPLEPACVALAPLAHIQPVTLLARPLPLSPLPSASVAALLTRRFVIHGRAPSWFRR